MFILLLLEVYGPPLALAASGVFNIYHLVIECLFTIICIVVCFRLVNHVLENTTSR